MNNRKEEHVHRPISELLYGRSLFLEIAVVAIILAFSVNTLSSLVFVWLQQYRLIIGVISGSLIAVSIIYLAARTLSIESKTIIIQGFLCYSRKGNALIDIPRYDFGDHLQQYLRAAFAEEKDLKIAWSTDPLSNILRRFEKKDDLVGEKSIRLIKEATEYYILAKLSTHLTDYFNQGRFEERYLKIFSREDIPAVLLTNRFLELFSKPMEDRRFFQENHGKGMHKGKVVMALGKSGAIYDRFELTLPKDSVVTREGKKLIIKMGRIRLEISVSFQGFGTVLPSEFKRYYQKAKQIDDTHDFLIEVELRIVFRLGTLLISKGWQYYRWIESFIKHLSYDLGEDLYFKQIGWDTASTVIEVLARHDA